MLNNPVDTTIEEWRPQHARWLELLALVTELHQTDWFTFTAEWHSSSHVLVAQRNSEIVGFLRFVLQDIGPDTDCPPVQWQGENLREAKVIALGVIPAQRRQGIGRKLQLPFGSKLKPWVVTKSGRIVVATIWRITSSNCH